VTPDQVALTSASVNALMLATQLLVEPGERVVEVVPLWPNLQEIPRILGAHVETVALKFSPNGWRPGWLVVPAELTADLGKLIEYNTSCAPVFVQRAGVAALKEGEPVIARTVQRFRRARDFLAREMNAIDGIEATPPSGTMYVFFKVRGSLTVLNFARDWCATPVSVWRWDPLSAPPARASCAGALPPAKTGGRRGSLACDAAWCTILGECTYLVRMWSGVSPKVQ
jgi:aspartate/methionine/tyrosine aminotransferase